MRDHAGNAGKWVSSVYHPYPYIAKDGRDDLDDTMNRRVYRGGLGSYIDYGTSAAKRFWLLPSGRDWCIGIRCAKDSG